MGKFDLKKLAIGVYLFAGLSGLYFLVMLIQNWGKYSNLGLWDTIALLGVTVGGINWLVKAVTKGKSDIFGN